MRKLKFDCYNNITKVTKNNRAENLHFSKKCGLITTNCVFDKILTTKGSRIKHSRILVLNYANHREDKFLSDSCPWRRIRVGIISSSCSILQCLVYFVSLFLIGPEWLPLLSLIPCLLRMRNTELLLLNPLALQISSIGWPPT